MITLLPILILVLLPMLGRLPMPMLGRLPMLMFGRLLTSMLGRLTPPGLVAISLPDPFPPGREPPMTGRFTFPGKVVGLPPSCLDGRRDVLAALLADSRYPKKAWIQVVELSSPVDPKGAW